MKLLELPMYLALGSLFLGCFIVGGANFYAFYDLSKSGKHWDIWNGYGICGGFDLGCLFSEIGNNTLRYVPPTVIEAIPLAFFGFGTIAMFIGDQSERVPAEVPA
jgi:hypothetical protein